MGGTNLQDIFSQHRKYKKCMFCYLNIIHTYKHIFWMFWLLFFAHDATYFFPFCFTHGYSECFKCFSLCMMQCTFFLFVLHSVFLPWNYKHSFCCYCDSYQSRTNNEKQRVLVLDKFYMITKMKWTFLIMIVY